jgi:hypothetical protein
MRHCLQDMKISSMPVNRENTRVFEEFDGLAVGARGVRFQKLSKAWVGHRMGDQKCIISSSSVLGMAR